MNNVPVDPSFMKEEESDLILKEILYKYLDYWKWFAISIGLSLIAAFFYLKFQAPIYSVQSSILIKDEKKGLGQDEMLKELNIFSSNKLVDNEIEILKSFRLIEKVVTSLNLNVRYFTPGRFHNVELYNDSPVYIEVINPSELAFEKPIKLNLTSQHVEIEGKQYNLNERITSPYGILKISRTGKKPDIKFLEVSIQPVEEVADELIGALKVEQSSKMSSVLILSLEISDLPKGRDILNKLISEYNNAALEDKNRVAANTLKFIEERLRLISGDLSEVEKDVQNFKSREGITDISAESQLFLEGVKENDNELNQVKIQQNVLDAIDLYVHQKKKTAGTVPATLGISDPTLLKLIESLTELESKRAETVNMAKADNPLVLTLDEQIRVVKSNIDENIQTLRKSLAITRRQLEQHNRKMEDMIKRVPSKERALIDITRQQAIKNNLYIYLLQKREETALSYASAVSDSRTIDFARGNKYPVKPVKRNVYLLFAILGIALPFAGIYIVELLDDKIATRNEIEKAIKTSVLGEISLSEDAEALIVSGSRGSEIGEQIRTLRTNLSFLTPGKNLKRILFTSSISGEGKSFISLNLGASLALAGKKTIILELDMRKPGLHKALEVENTRGLSNYLIGACDLSDLIIPVPGQENYYIITSGPLPPNPAELLAGDRLGELFQELQTNFDIIIVDAPPIGLVTDAQIIERYVDVTLFVVRHRFTPKALLKAVNGLMKDKRFRNLHLIFNGIKKRSRYGYEYGYSYSYYSDLKETNKIKN